MPKDDLGYEHLRRSDGGALIIAAWVCGVSSIICAVAGVLVSSFDLTVLAGAFGSLWAVFFITGHVTRAIYFVAGDELKPQSERTSLRRRSEQGYRRSEI